MPGSLAGPVVHEKVIWINVEIWTPNKGLKTGLDVWALSSKFQDQDRGICPGKAIGHRRAY